jgi:anti-sigma regulatory factor (Ser/Thr protein kinase)
MNELALSVVNRLPDVVRVVGEVEGFARAHDVPPRASAAFTLALDELMTNVVKYAWRAESEHRFTVSVRIADRRLSAEILDDGEAYDPLTTPEADLSGTIDERPIGGLGVHIVRRTMDEFTYERTGGRNRQFISKMFETREPTR